MQQMSNGEKVHEARVKVLQSEINNLKAQVGTLVHANAKLRRDVDLYRHSNKVRALANGDQEALLKPDEIFPSW